MTHVKGLVFLLASIMFVALCIGYATAPSSEATPVSEASAFDRPDTRPVFDDSTVTYLLEEAWALAGPETRSTNCALWEYGGSDWYDTFSFAWWAASIRMEAAAYPTVAAFMAEHCR